MPFVIRRKSDGKFWRNKDYHSDHHCRIGPGEEDYRFVEDVSEVKPFFSVAGAKSSRCPVDAKGDRTWREWMYTTPELRDKLTQERFDELYEVLPVEVKLVLSEAK